ncbi:TPA: hypothetical protein ACGAIE_004313 [Yersinia enterocolitica]
MNNIEEFEAAYNTYMERDVGTPVEKFKHPVPGVTYKYQHANSMLAFWNVARTRLIAQLEAAQQELIKPLPIGELVQRLEGQTYEKWFSESDVKDLRERAEKAEAALSAANEKLLVPGVLHCAKCSFQLAKTNLYMASGTTGPGDNKTEPCPNGCGPLWPVTWEQWSREIGVQLDRYFDEAKELKAKLANPVVLNTSDIMSRKHVTEAIKAAGFTVEGE